MLVVFFGLGILFWVILMDFVTGQRQSSARYFLLFFIILTSMYTAKGYCDFYEDNFEYAYLLDEEDDAPPKMCEVKFVPPGTPSNYINEDGSLSKTCLKVVESTNKTLAFESMKLHAEKGEYHYMAAKEICWYLPKVKDRDVAKMAFTTTLALFPGPIHWKLVVATGALLTEYGICCIDAFYDIDFNINMAIFHFRLQDAFHKHIKNNGWYQ